MASGCGFRVAFLCKNSIVSVVCVNNFFTRCSAVYKKLGFPIKSTGFSFVGFFCKTPLCGLFFTHFPHNQ